jgi:alpha-2-macroglobulin
VDLAGDKGLQFTPKSDWPIDASFTVKIARKGFLARTVRLDDYSFKFKNPAVFGQNHQQPVLSGPAEPNAQEPGRHGWLQPPVDTTQFDQHVSLIPAKEADFLGLTPDSKHFTVVYDKLKTLRVHPFGRTRNAARRHLHHRGDQKGVRAARGGNQTGEKLAAVVAIPGRTSLRFDGAQMTLVDNARYEPEQVLLSPARRRWRSRRSPAR